MELQSLQTVGAIAQSVAREAPGNFEVAGVLRGEVRGAYAEVLLVSHVAAGPPTRKLISVSRDTPEHEIRQSVAAQLAT